MDEFIIDNTDFEALTKSQSNSGSVGTRGQRYNSMQNPNTVSGENSYNLGDLDPFQLSSASNLNNNDGVISAGGIDDLTSPDYNTPNTAAAAAMPGTSNTNTNLNPNSNATANNGPEFIFDPRDDFLSPTTSYSNDNNFGIFGADASGGGTSGNGYDPLMEELGYTMSNPQQSTSSFQQFGLPPLGLPLQHRHLTGFMPPMATTNLDELISSENINPGNPNSSNMLGSSLSSPQYFSPPTRGTNFNALNSIAESSFSPLGTRQGSISIPHKNINTDNNKFDAAALATSTIGNGYLSPSNYMSPLTNVNSLDLLRSPSYGGGTGSYLNSPPDFQISQPADAPLGANFRPNDSNIPSSSNPLVGVAKQLETSPSGTLGKQLTKEEKMKRRREFHNAVERRRRDLIKERIKDLGVLVPPSMLNPQLAAVQAMQRNSLYSSREINELIINVKAKETKPNKSTILNKSVDYVVHLEDILRRQRAAREELERKIAEVERELNSGAGAAPRDTGPQDYIQGYSNHDDNQTDLKRESSSVFNPNDFFLDVVTGTTNNMTDDYY